MRTLKTLRVWPIIASLVALALVMLACGGTGTTGSDTSGSGGSSTTPAPAKVAKVGQTITSDGVACTPTSATVIQGDEFDQPKAGNEFIVVHIKLHNGGSSDFAYSGFDFKSRSTSGNVLDAELTGPSTYTANALLDNGTLSAGGSVEGDVILQVKVGDHGSELVWQPSILSSSGDNVWSLGI